MLVPCIGKHYRAGINGNRRSGESENLMFLTCREVFRPRSGLELSFCANPIFNVGCFYPA
jgi:hypothetical protein